MRGLYKQAGSRFWWLRFTQGGKRHAVSLQTDDESLAITKARAIMAEGVLGSVTKDLDSAITQYLGMAQKRAKKPMRPETAKRQGHVLRKYATDNGIEFVGQITHGNIEGWLSGLKNDGRSPDTIHTYARSLHTFASYLVKCKLIRGDLLRDFEIPERGAVGRKNWLKNSEVNRVISQCKNDLLKFVLFCGFHSGMRKNEICNAKVFWFDLDADLIHVQNDVKSGFILKDRENRAVPISPSFKEFLNCFLVGRRKDEFVLHPDKGQGIWRYRYDFARAFATHMRRCGVVCSIHDMRRSFASNLVSSGKSIYKVAKYLGDGVQVVERSYGHVAPADGELDVLG